MSEGYAITNIQGEIFAVTKLAPWLKRSGITKTNNETLKIILNPNFNLVKRCIKEVYLLDIFVKQIDGFDCWGYKLYGDGIFAPVCQITHEYFRNFCAPTPEEAHQEAISKAIDLVSEL